MRIDGFLTCLHFAPLFTTFMMPSSHSPPPHTVNGGPVGSANLANGVNQVYAPNGNNQAVGNPNGAEAKIGPAQSNKASIEIAKEKAKALMMAPSLAKEDSSTTPVNVDSTLDSSTSDRQANMTAQSRKRSRSGSRLPKSPPRVQSTGSKPDRTQAALETYLNREQLHTSAIQTATQEFKNMIPELHAEIDYLKQLRDPHPRRLEDNFNLAFLGLGYAGYGNGLQDVVLPRDGKIIPPAARRRPGNRRTKELRIKRKEQATQAEQFEELVPIRLDIEWDKIRLRDTFTWNIHDRVVSPELFAQQLVEDICPGELPHSEALVHQIVNNILEQISDFHPHIFLADEALDPHLPYFAYKNDEMRIVIKLNITIGQHTLVDQFEWDINNPANNPEQFAQQMTTDLCLSGEFATAIAHSIREQCQLFTRSLYVTGHAFDGRPIEDHELLASFQPSPLPSVFRPHQAAKDFTPYLYEWNEQELEKHEMSMSREERRQKRSVNRRGGPALPDLKDRRRTIRTLLVSSVLPGAVQSYDDSRLFKKVLSSNRGKRGAARMDGFEDSDDSESEESSVDSPAVPSHLLAGTARTRGMRGAATAAQAATRANLGRSATPDSMVAHHHETRISGRRIIHDESSPEPPLTKIVKLRLPRQRFKQLLQNIMSRSKDASQSTPGRPVSRQSSAAPTATPGPMGPPISTPRMQSQSLLSQPNGTPNSQSQTPQASKHGTTSQLGRVDATGPPGPEHPIVSSIPQKSFTIRSIMPLYLRIVSRRPPQPYCRRSTSYKPSIRMTSSKAQCAIRPFRRRRTNHLQ